MNRTPTLLLGGLLASTLVASTAMPALAATKATTKKAATASGKCTSKASIKWVTLIFNNTDPIEKAFETANPCIDLTVEKQPFPDIYQQIQIRLQSGADMDVVSVDLPLATSYAVRGWLAPLDGIYTAKEKADFLPASLQAGTVKGKLVAAPSSNSTQLLYINKDLLAKAGVTAPGVDDRWTWEQVLAAGKKVATKDTFGFTWEQTTAVYQLGVLPGSLGAKMIGTDGFTVDGIINGPEWVKAMKLYQDVFSSGVGPKGDAVGAAELFTTGKVAMMVGGPWNITAFADAKLPFGWTVSRHPLFQGGKIATPTGSWHLGVNAKSKNQKAAKTFVHWMTTGAGAALWGQVGSRDFPAQQSLIAKFSTDAKYASEPLAFLKTAAQESVTSPLPRALTPGFLEYDQILGQAFSDIRGGADVQSTLNDAVKKINTEMAKYKS